MSGDFLQYIMDIMNDKIGSFKEILKKRIGSLRAKKWFGPAYVLDTLVLSAQANCSQKPHTLLTRLPLALGPI